MLHALRSHWPEYLMEAAGLGLFMVSACAFGALLEHPSSPLHRALAGQPYLRLALMGLAMGGTFVAIAYSPWGKQSGAHLNPSVTLAFLRLGRVAPADAFFYVLAQFAGGLAGIGLGLLAWRARAAVPEVMYVATLPGKRGRGMAFLAEAGISFGLMSVVLFATNRPALAPYTGLLAGGLVAAYITFEAPLSGMSMNPARTVASAVPARSGRHLWIYFAAPLLGMLLAAELRTRLGAPGAACAKLDHDPHVRCIFCGAEPKHDPTTTSRSAP
jgi:aquaporin Z